jgi:hypothetical protein
VLATVLVRKCSLIERGLRLEMVLGPLGPRSRWQPVCRVSHVEDSSSYLNLAENLRCL